MTNITPTEQTQQFDQETSTENVPPLSMSPLCCPNCGGQRFHFSEFGVYVFFTDVMAMGDAEEFGLDDEAGATCRGCGANFDSNSEIWKAIRQTWDATN